MAGLETIYLDNDWNASTYCDRPNIACGLGLAEPTTTLTDFALALESVILCFYILRRPFSTKKYATGKVLPQNSADVEIGGGENTEANQSIHRDSSKGNGQDGSPCHKNFTFYRRPYFSCFILALGILSLGVSWLLGGIYHGWGIELLCADRPRCIRFCNEWVACLFFQSTGMGLIGAASAELILVPRTNPKHLRALTGIWIYLIVAMVIYTILITVGAVIGEAFLLSFRTVIIFSGPVLLLVLVLLSLPFCCKFGISKQPNSNSSPIKKDSSGVKVDADSITPTRESGKHGAVEEISTSQSASKSKSTSPFHKGAVGCLVGWIIVIVGLGWQATKISIHEHFNYNDIFHTIVFVGKAVFVVYFDKSAEGLEPIVLSGQRIVKNERQVLVEH